jgi:2-dehydropantoate 2-reductase
MKITVIGAGAIGGVLGAHLARAGYQVVLCDIAREHVRAINETGLRIEGPEETFTVKATALTPEDLLARGETLETVLLCVKAQHTEGALRPVLPLIQGDSQVVSCQNGLCENIIASLIGPEKTIGCFVNFSADYLEPGRILYGGPSTFVLGELDGTISARLLKLQEVLQAWRPVQVSTNIWGYLWSKLSYAALLYATALVDATMAEVVGNMRYREALLELCSEVLEVADKEQVIPLGFDDWEPSLIYPRSVRDEGILNARLLKLEHRMAANRKTKSGIWRDLAVRKRPTEVDYQLVPVIRIGGRYGLPLPLTSFVVKVVKELEAGKRTMSWENLEELNRVYENNRIALDR